MIALWRDISRQNVSVEILNMLHGLICWKCVFCVWCTVMQLWDGLATTEADVLIIGATNRPQDLDPAVQRRFERSFLLSLPDEESRLDIFRKALASVPKEKGFDFSLCSRLTEGYASSDIAMVCKAAVRQMEKESRPKQRQGTGTGPLEPKARPLLSQVRLLSLWYEFIH